MLSSHQKEPDSGEADVVIENVHLSEDGIEDLGNDLGEEISRAAESTGAPRPALEPSINFSTAAHSKDVAGPSELSFSGSIVLDQLTDVLKDMVSVSSYLKARDSKVESLEKRLFARSELLDKTLERLIDFWPHVVKKKGEEGKGSAKRSRVKSKERATDRSRARAHRRSRSVRRSERARSAEPRPRTPHVPVHAHKRLTVPLSPRLHTRARARRHPCASRHRHEARGRQDKLGAQESPSRRTGRAGSARDVYARLSKPKQAKGRASEKRGAAEVKPKMSVRNALAIALLHKFQRTLRKKPSRESLDDFEAAKSVFQPASTGKSADADGKVQRGGSEPGSAAAVLLASAVVASSDTQRARYISDFRYELQDQKLPLSVRTIPILCFYLGAERRVERAAVLAILELLRGGMAPNALPCSLLIEAISPVLLSTDVVASNAAALVLYHLLEIRPEFSRQIRKHLANVDPELVDVVFGERRNK